MADVTEKDRWLQSLKQSAGQSEANWWTTLILSLLLGWMGADRFYLGSPVLGIIKFVTMGGFIVWWVIDLILLCANRMKDDNGAIVRRPF